MTDMNLLELVASIAQVFGPSGNEDNVREVINPMIEGEGLLDDVHVDALGNLIGVKRGSGNGKKIMLAAHMDEIGLIVTFVDEKGFLRFGRVGGVSALVALGQKVIFENGVTGTVWYEDKSDAMKDTRLDKMYIDIGATSREEALKMIQIGDMCVFVGDTVESNGKIISKALDDRLGCAILVALVRSLPEKVENDIYFVFTVQEEVGCRGSGPAAYGILPDMALAIDVTASGDTPECSHFSADLGKGPTIKIMDARVVAHPEVKDKLRSCAEAAGIPYQYEILHWGGTDAGPIHLTAGGIPSGGVSIPTRYVHSPAEMVSMSDVHNAIRLLKEFVLN